MQINGGSECGKSMVGVTVVCKSIVGVSVVNLIGFFAHPTLPSTIAAAALRGRLAEPCGLVSGKISPFSQNGVGFYIMAQPYFISLWFLSLLAMPFSLEICLA